MIKKMMVVAALLGATGTANAQNATSTNVAPVAVRASDLPKPPVIAGDISDRPYTVIGEVRAGVRKATLFSAPASPEKVFRILWKRAEKMGADAVVHASFGASHVSAMSWGQTDATGIAVKFSSPAPLPAAAH